MNNDKSTRLITLGEAHVDPEKHVILNPLHNYDEDVEFVSDITKVHAEPPKEFDSSAVKAQIASIEEDIYQLYGLRNPEERKNFLRGSENAVVPYMEAIL